MIPNSKAGVNEGSANRDRGSIGARDRCSIQTKAPGGDHRQPNRSQHNGTEEAQRPGLDHRCGQRGHGQGCGRLPGQIEAAIVPFPLRLLDLQHQEGADQADRQIDEKDAPPAIGAEQQPADDRAGPDGDAASCGPPSHRLGPKLGVMGGGVVHERQGGGHHGRRAYALDYPARDQQGSVRRQAAGQRAESEQPETRQVDAARAKTVAQKPGAQQQRREHQGIGIDDPLQAGGIGVQRLGELRQGDIDDGHVELNQPEPETGGKHGPADAGGGAVGHPDYRDQRLASETTGSNPLRQSRSSANFISPTGGTFHNRPKYGGPPPPTSRARSADKAWHGA
jgi:hypothetical protein